MWIGYENDGLKAKYKDGPGGTMIVGTVAPAASLLVGFGVAWHLASMPENVRTTILFWISLPLTFSGLRVRAHLDILIPQVLSSAVAAYCLVAAVAIGAYGTALALVGTQVNILPLQLYSKISGTGTDFPAAAALSVLLMALCSLVLGAGEIFAARKERRYKGEA